MDQDQDQDQRAGRACRIRAQVDFDRVFQAGVVAVDHVLVVHGVPNRRDQTRLGLSVSRKVGSAPRRNRWKRLIREAFRQSRPALPAGYDLVVRPRRGARPDYHAIARSLPRLANRIMQRWERSRS